MSLVQKFKDMFTEYDEDYIDEMESDDDLEDFDAKSFVDAIIS